MAPLSFPRPSYSQQGTCRPGETVQGTTWFQALDCGDRWGNMKDFVIVYPPVIKGGNGKSPYKYL